jgi:hypothetical protein
MENPTVQRAELELEKRMRLIGCILLCACTTTHHPEPIGSCDQAIHERDVSLELQQRTCVELQGEKCQAAIQAATIAQQKSFDVCTGR